MLQPIFFLGPPIFQMPSIVRLKIEGAHPQSSWFNVDYIKIAIDLVT